jgi:hypothetical protein
MLELMNFLKLSQQPDLDVRCLHNAPQVPE